MAARQPTTTTRTQDRRNRRRRHTFWHRSLAEARLVTAGHGSTWYRIPKLYTRKTAAQIASDLRRAHLRDPEHQRVRGLAPGERWDAAWRPTDNGAVGDCELWVRLVAVAVAPV